MGWREDFQPEEELCTGPEVAKSLIEGNYQCRKKKRALSMADIGRVGRATYRSLGFVLNSARSHRKPLSRK